MLKNTLKPLMKFKIEPAEQITNKKAFSLNYLLGVSMLYMALMILSGTTVYKIITIGYYIGPAGILVTPFIYSLSNVTTEVYGYAVARNMMWWFVISSFVFTFGGSVLSVLPSPQDFHEQHAFNVIFGSMPIVFIAGTIGTIFGISFNNYVVSKLKIHMNSKKYWIRSFISTAGGEILYNFIAYPIMWYHKVPFDIFIKIFISVTLFKMATTCVVWPLECLFAAFLKKKEGINTMDYNVKYNIFHFSVHKYKKPSLKIVK